MVTCSMFQAKPFHDAVQLLLGTGCRFCGAWSVNDTHDCCTAQVGDVVDRKVSRIEIPLRNHHNTFFELAGSGIILRLRVPQNLCAGPLEGTP